MRLTWKDGVTTLLAGLVVAVTLALTQGWSWPLLGDYRAGVVAVLAIGFGMCIAGGASGRTYSASDPLLMLSVLLGLAALALGVFGLVVATETALVALAVVVIALWVVATVRHALRPASGAPGGTRPAAS